VPGWSATTVETLTLKNCPGSNTTTSTDFYNIAFQDLGYSVAGDTYAVWRAPPVFPVSVKVGDTGSFGTIDYYTDSTKATPDGFSDVRFIVLPRTADTVIVEAQSTVFDATGQEEGWEGDQWAITSSGAMTRVLVQFFTPPGPGSGGELVLFFHD
jgi:hypothetical protein